MKFEEWLSQQTGVIEVDCGCVTTEAFYHWLRVAYEAGNSPEIPDGSAVAALTGTPMIPDGYVLVPREPTDEMIAAAMNCDDVEFNSDETFCVQFGNIYEAMIAAAPHDTPALNSVQSVVTVSDTWIPVSERLPDDEQEVLTINKMGHRFVSFFDKHSGLFFDRLDAPAAYCIEHVLVTHWMPLPAAPQEVTSARPIKK